MKEGNIGVLPFIPSFVLNVLRAIIVFFPFTQIVSVILQKVLRNVVFQNDSFLWKMHDGESALLSKMITF